MKNLVFQVNIKPNGAKPMGRKRFAYSNSLYDFSNERAKKYANEFNADYFCLDTDEWLGSGYTPAFHKLYLYNLFPNYDKILCLDSDAVITKNCPNIFNYDILSATRDNNLSPSGIKKEKRKHEIHNLSNSHIYFCSGVVLFDKLFYEKTKDSWRDELNYWPKQKGVQHDQTIWNVLTDKYYGKYNILDDDWGSWRKRGKFINHYSGPTETSEWTKEKFLRWESKLL